MCLLGKQGELDCGGGVMTPGYALGDKLIDRLKVGGTLFAAREVVDKK